MFRFLINLLFKNVIMVLSILFGVGYGLALINELINFNITAKSSIYFLGGVIVFIPVWFIWVKKNNFFSVFEHEFTHLVAGLVFFKKPVGFLVKENGEGATYLCGENFIITLAPYFFPTFVCGLLIVSLVIDTRFANYYFALLGIFTSYHILSTFKEFSYHQPDIKKRGMVFSTIFLLFANVIFYGFLVAFVNGGFKESGRYLKEGLLKSKHGISYVFVRLGDRVMLYKGSGSNK